MSGLTNYTSGGIDLSNIFAPYTGGNPAPETGYSVNGNDLNTIFQPYASGSKANPTGYKVNDNDLNNIFAIKLPFTTTSTYSYIFDASENYIVSVTSAGSFNFIQTVKSLELVILGGGGGGGGGLDNENVQGNGYGGAGGGQAILSYNDASFNSLNKTFTINSIGSGGIGGLYNVGGGTPSTGGGTTIVSDPSSNIYTLTGGQGGDINTAAPPYIAQSGTCTVSPSNPSYALLTSGTGGNGGGFYANGQNSYLYTSGNNLITYLGLGGGGGGGAGGFGGSAQGNGQGGSASGGGNTNAFGYGAGGGSCFQFANGGFGTPGIVVFYFKYP